MSSPPLTPPRIPTSCERTVKMASTVEMSTQTEPVKVSEVEFEYPERQAVYTMAFSADIERKGSGYHKVRQEHMDEAREEMGSANLWRDWMAWTLRDACETDWKIQTGKEVYPKEPPVEILSVELEAQVPKSKFDRDSWKQVKGKVTWKGPLCSMPALREAVQWRIGDRMCYYGVESMDEKGWVAYTRPGVLTINAI